jgi:hypothetical protein
MNNSYNLKWKFKTGGSVSSSPAISQDGTIYFGSYDNYFYAINPDGRLKWKFEVGGYVSSSPSISSDGIIYFGRWDRYFYALSSSSKLAESPWPKFKGDLRNTGSGNLEISVSLPKEIDIILFDKDEKKYIGKTCPYCQFVLKPGVRVKICPSCEVPHHQECWDENGGCTTYGCAEGPR